MSGLDNQKKGQLGVNVVERIVITEWCSRWQQIDGFNDDGIDGLIFIEHNGKHTGQIIHVQVKCSSKSECANKIRGCEGIDKLEKHRDRWLCVVGATILVHVNLSTLSAHWVDLKNPAAFTNSEIIIPTDQRFDKKSKRKILELSGSIHRDLKLKTIKTTADDFNYLSSTCKKSSSWKYYKYLRDLNIKFSEQQLTVHFTREGWKHINRKKRSRLKREQSLLLLGAIPKLISSCSKDDLHEILGIGGKPSGKVYIIGVVMFPFRAAAIVKIVFWDRGADDMRNLSFCSIYEPRRARNIIGIRG